MEGTYQVYLGQREIGTVQLIPDGLYVRCRCRCRLPGDVICRLTADFGDRQEHLGILMPDGEGFSLDAKIAARRMAPGNPRFFAEPNRTVTSGRFVPLSPQEPFAYLSNLKQAYLEKREGRAGIVIPNQGRK